VRSSKTNFQSCFALCLLSLAGSAAARASTITLYVTGADTGVITLTESGNDTPITAISGTFDGAGIGALIPTGGLGNNDNTFYTPSPYLDDVGVSFSLMSADTHGFTDVNLSYTGSSGYESVQGDSTARESGVAFYEFDSLSTSQTPEPAAVGLTLLGLACIFTRWRGMNRKVDRV